MRELKVMKQLQPHPNIISLLGCSTTSGTLSNLITVLFLVRFVEG